jgi:Flp pilus assembly protein TadG
MKPAAIRRFRSAGHSRQGERGVTMVLVALAMIAIIAMAALSIDVITLYLAREEAQRAADAAALAAARVISISGVTGDPGGFATWESACSSATDAATAVATQSAIGGTVANVLVTYSSGSTSSSDCAAIPGAFRVNPLVTVKIVRASLPTFFSRIWGNTGNSISATATAEVFNPSASNAHTTSGFVTPVQPSCVKPWMVPNQDPNHPSTTCNGAACLPFVSPANGAIQSAGIVPVTPGGIIGSTFNLFADCGAVSPCARPTPQPQANDPGVGPFNGNIPPATPNLEYLPGAAPPSSVAVPACATSVSGGVPEYEPAVAGCDQSTIYQCGVPSSVAAPPANSIDLTENPGGSTGDTANGISCLINQSAGQDSLDITAYPYKITPGSGNPLSAALSGSVISSSNSIVSLPIYDTTNPLTFTGNQANVTIVGFLQVFINQVNPDGSLNVKVLNVAGCGTSASTAANTAVTGSSPVPVRLVTPP